MEPTSQRAEESGRSGKGERKSLTLLASVGKRRRDNGGGWRAGESQETAEEVQACPSALCPPPRVGKACGTLAPDRTSSSTWGEAQTLLGFPSRTSVCVWVCTQCVCAVQCSFVEAAPHSGRRTVCCITRGPCMATHPSASPPSLPGLLLLGSPSL